MVVFDRYREKFLNLLSNRVWSFGEKKNKNITDNTCKMYICIRENFTKVGDLSGLKIYVRLK